MKIRPSKIIHIGDIHIFFSKKFEAHEFVFNEFYKKLEIEKPELIVIAGDLIDSKTKLSPEQFNIGRNFLLNCASYCPLLIILGNHDLNLNNKERLDSISPIVYSLNNETTFPIHFFKNSGVYDLYNIKWAVWSCLDDQLKPEINREADDYIIGLYHGAVKGCVSDNGFILTEGIDIKEFDEVDICMMADIHKRQTFRSGDIVYSGSILQTKISEPAHGSYVVWTLKNDKYVYEFKDLDNIYSTITTDLNDLDKVVTENENQLIIIKYDSSIISKTESIRLRKELQAKYKNKIEFKPSIKKKVKLIETVEENKIKKKVDLQVAMNDYLATLKITPEEKKLIIELDLEYESNLDLSKDFEQGDFTIRLIELTNFLSFEKAIIDFDKDGVIGISGKNRIGKSSVIKGIIFALYNSSPDNNSSLKKLINKHNSKEEANVTLYLSKSGKNYKISRTLTPKKKEGVTTLLEFDEVDDFFNEVKSLTGEKRQDTEKEIQKYFGIESAFEILSLYSAQTKQQELIDCKNTERLKLINRFIGLQTYEAKLEAVNEDYKNEKIKYQIILKDFNQSKDLSVMDKELMCSLLKEDEINIDILDLKESEKISDFKNRHLVSNYELNKKISSKIVIDPVDSLLEIEVIKKKIENKKEEKRKSIELIKISNEKKDKITLNFFGQYNGEINKYKIDWKSMKAEEGELAVMKSDIKKLESQLIERVCQTCEKPFTTDDVYNVQRKIEELKNDIAELEITVFLFDEKNKKINHLQNLYSDYKDELDTYSNDLKKIDLEINSFDTNIENLNLKSIDWEEVKAAKLKLIDLEKEYLNLLLIKKDNEKTLNMLQNDLGSIRTTIKLLRKEIDIYNTHFNNLTIVESKMNVLKLYKEVVNKDGLPLYILKTKIFEINEQINLIVSQVFDFEVEFSVTEGDLNIDFFYENDEIKNDVGFASGSETFIINLCIKVGLSQISELPKLTSLLIDEGYGTLDAETIAKIPALFSVLPEYYKNIITISHIEELKELYQHQIKLEKIGKYTEVTY